MQRNTRVLSRIVLMLMLLIGLSAATPLTGSAQKGGNSQAGKACAGRGYADLVREDGSRFRNAGECMRYAAEGGTLDRDVDGDGVPTSSDNCAEVANAEQLDSDGDGTGDACDPTPNGDDTDGDGVPDSVDNCAGVANAGQHDADRDGTGDACDSDIDNDGVQNSVDNCPSYANPSQDDNDGDGIGNFCDYDLDNDGIENMADNCAVGFNPDQADRDGDGTGDLCDSYPDDPTRDGGGGRYY